MLLWKITQQWVTALISFMANWCGKIVDSGLYVWKKQADYKHPPSALDHGYDKLLQIVAALISLWWWMVWWFEWKISLIDSGNEISGLQLVTLFGEVTDPLWGRTLPDEVCSWGQALRMYSLPQLAIGSLHFICGWRCELSASWSHLLLLCPLSPITMNSPSGTTSPTETLPLRRHLVPCCFYHSNRA